MKNWLIFIVISAILIFLFTRPKQLLEADLQRFPENGNTSTIHIGGASSSDKCLTVFVAPWCGPCHNAQPVINSLADDLTAHGRQMTVVVTSDKLPALEKYAMGFRGAVAIDPDGKYIKAAKINEFPHFVVTNQKGEITKTFGGAIDNKDIFKKLLGLD